MPNPILNPQEPVAHSTPVAPVGGWMRHISREGSGFRKFLDLVMLLGLVLPLLAAGMAESASSSAGVLGSTFGFGLFSSANSEDGQGKGDSETGAHLGQQDDEALHFDSDFLHPSQAAPQPLSPVERALGLPPAGRVGNFAVQPSSPTNDPVQPSR